MTKATHTVFGILTALTFNVPISTTILGSLAPDLDWKITKKEGSLLFSHRGITHHLILTLFLIFFSIVIENIWIKGFLYGYLSHIFIDILNKTGIPYWRYRDRIGFKLIRTGSLEEYLFIVPLAFVVIGIIILISGFKGLLPFEVSLYLHLINQ